MGREVFFTGVLVGCGTFLISGLKAVKFQRSEHHEYIEKERLGNEPWALPGFVGSFFVTAGYELLFGQLEFQYFFCRVTLWFAGGL